MNSGNYTNSNAENCKVVLIGETGVGKTCLISRFCHNKFESVFMPTPGASFTSKTLYIDEFDKVIQYEVRLISVLIDMGYCWPREVPFIVEDFL